MKSGTGLAVVAAVTTAIAAVAVLWLAARAPLPGIEAGADVANAIFVVGMTVLAATGALLVQSGRYPRMGRLMVATGWANVMARLLTVPAYLALEAGHTAIAQWLGWLTNWAWLPGQALALIMILRFPDGQVRGPARRLLERVVLGWFGMAVLATALVPGPLGAQPLEPLTNPLGVAALSGPLDALLTVVFLAHPLLIGLSVASMLVRWARAQSVQRRQLTTLVLALAVLAIAAPLAALSGVAAVAEGLAWLVLPVALAYAMLRHGLWDVDLERRFDRLWSVREDERNRLRRDLHDSLGPLLGSISMRAETGRNMLVSGALTDRLDRLFSSMSTDCDNAVAEVRRVIEELGPTALANEDLAGALRRLATTSPLAGPTVSVEVSSLPELDPASELTAYRVATEAVRNAGRHSGARSCHLEMGMDGHDLMLSVADDGVGLGQSSAGTGRRGMAERVAAVGGTLTVEEPPTGGVLVRMRLVEALA